MLEVLNKNKEQLTFQLEQLSKTREEAAANFLRVEGALRLLDGLIAEAQKEFDKQEAADIEEAEDEQRELDKDN